MARSRKLTELRLEVYQRADIDPKSGYINEKEMDAMLNGSLAELYDLVVSVNKDFFLDSDDVSVTSGTDAYALADDLYKPVGVDVEDGGRWFPLRKFMFAERNQLQDNVSEKRDTRYRVMGSNLRLRPSPGWSGTVRVWYIPAPPVLTGSQSWDGVAGWEEYAIVDCLIKIKQKQEEEDASLVARLAKLEARIKSAANERDAGEPDRVRDVDEEMFGTWLPPG